MSPRTLLALDRRPVSELKAVPARKVAGLRALGIETVFDLLTNYPRRYVDRTEEVPISQLREGALGVVTGEVVRSSARRLRGGRSLAEIVLYDGTGSLTCTFFNQGWRARQFAEGQLVTVFGRVGSYRHQLQMASPGIDLVGDLTGRIVPVYRQSGKARISSVDLYRFVTEALQRAGELADPVDAGRLAELGLVDRTAAYRDVHAPEEREDADRAKARLAFDELLRLQLLLLRKKRDFAASAVGLTHDTTPGGLVASFVAALPFRLTKAQARAVHEIAADLAQRHPMHRLLQGDVGSGKTVVAVAAMLYGVQGGHQGALMVPTEVLAEQHFFSVRGLLEGFSVPDPSRLGGERPLAVELLTSRTPPGDRSRILAELAEGQVDVIVGTHALLTGDVGFSSLGVVVVDEQHRFGVEQRAALAAKSGVHPDLLVMTATPIPRTAAMTVYGDLDHTTLDEMPPGRTPVTTRLVRWHEESAAWKRVRAELEEGHQAYVVCPLVGGGSLQEDGWESDPEPGPLEDEDGDGCRGREEGRLALGLELERPPPRAAVEELERLAAGELQGCRLGLLHGQLPSKEKDTVMSAFRAGEVQVLVATTVVEVGVDVANATVMVIEDADRFGIAQLHQLRGRVGRGVAGSYCFLVADAATDLAQRRLEAVVRTENGFELAEADLELRGGGTVLGSRQKGRSDLRVANLGQYRQLVTKAREVAAAILDEDPDLAEADHRLLWDEAELFWSEEERQFLFRS